MSQELRFDVLSSSGNGSYNVRAVREGRILRMSCECDAAINGTHCKHRLDLLKGDTSSLLSANRSDVAILMSWIPGTPVEEATRIVEECERAANLAKRNLSSAKKLLGSTLVTGRFPD